MKRINALVNKYGFVAHPLLFAVFPLLSFYGANVSEIRSGDFSLETFFLFNFIVAVISWIISLLLTRNRQKASILTLIFLAVFFTFGRAYDALHGFVINTPIVTIGPTKLLAAMGGILVITVWFWLRKLSTERANKINSTLVLIGGVIVASTFFSIVPTYLSGNSDEKPNKNEASQSGSSKETFSGERPDIYYILLDAYARGDYLKKNFDFDNSIFINSLKDKGFYVAEQSNSNYAHTHFSVPSTFNMKYLNYLAEEVGENSTNRLPLKELTKNNEVVPKFQSLGYKYVNIGSQWGWSTESPYTDIDIKAKKNTDSKILNIELDEFALVYLQTTAIKPWVSKDIRGGLLTKILGAFERTEEVPPIDEPTLTFTHIVSPHPPYLFDRNGPIQGKTKLELLNDQFSEKDKFVDQTVYINKLVLDLTEKILRESDKPPIIIVASDHGPASDLTRSEFEVTDPKKLDKKGVRERMGILNAYYFPDRNYSDLYQSISPVNSFRLILNQYFGQNIELLPDRSYFSNNKANEYLMLDVTGLVKRPAD